MRSERPLPTRLAVIAGVVWLVVGCGGLRAPRDVRERRAERAADEWREKVAAQPRPREVLVGRVDVVHEGNRFVLVRVNRGIRLEPGAGLEARGGDGVAAVLTVSPEYNERYLVADFKEVVPAVGDLVFLPLGADGEDEESAEEAGPGDRSDEGEVPVGLESIEIPPL